MEKSNPEILFTLIHNNHEYHIQVLGRQYYSLMILIADHLGIPDFGLCSGMGSCGTCLVHIRKKHSGANRTVLSCDISVNEQLNDTIVFIPGKII